MKRIKIYCKRLWIFCLLTIATIVIFFIGWFEIGAEVLLGEHDWDSWWPL